MRVQHASKSDHASISSGNDVWIGSGAQILSGVSIGDGAIVGAGPVVTKDVDPYSIMVGNPARRTRYRFDDKTIEDLIESKWWMWSEERLMAEQAFLTKVRAAPE